MPKKLAFIDVETTGLDPYFNGIHQLALLLEVDGVVVEEKSWNIKPFERDRIDPKALAVSGRTEEDFLKFPVPQLIHSDLLTCLKKYVDPYRKTDKFWFIGYNALFDYQFLRKWFEKLGDKFCGSFFWHPPLDVMTLMGFHLMESRPEMKDFKLKTVAEEMAIDVEDGRFHDALFDVAITRELFHMMFGGRPCPLEDACGEVAPMELSNEGLDELMEQGIDDPGREI